jgi:RHS repeat-associated protein
MQRSFKLKFNKLVQAISPYKFGLLGILVIALGIAGVVAFNQNNQNQQKQELIKEAERIHQFTYNQASGSNEQTFTYVDGKVKLIFPLGFSEQPLDISFRTLNSSTYGAAGVIGPVYELKAFAKDGSEVSKFAKAIRIETTLADEEQANIDQAAGGTYFYSTEARKWERLDSTISEGKIVASTDHFTVFTSSQSDANGSVLGANTVAQNNTGSTGGNAAAAASGAVVDDSDPEPAFVPRSQGDGTQPGFWGSITAGYNKSAIYTGNSYDNKPRNWATWTADGINGELEVFATIPGVKLQTPAGYTRPLTTQATYKITHAGGTTIKTVNQRASAGGKVSLGTYTFNGTGSVYLNDVVPEKGANFLSFIVFDAISFGDLLVGDMDITPPLIEDVKVSTDEGYFYIQAKVTDTQSGVGIVLLYLKRADGSMIIKEMTLKGTDIYGVRIDGLKRGENLDYEIKAVDKAGIAGFWKKGRGYMARSSFARYNGSGKFNRTALDYSYLVSGGMCRVCNPRSNYSQNVNDPINSVTGNLIDVNKLAFIPGRPNIDLHITYNSQGGRLSIFGESWTHSYNYHVLDMDNPDFTGAFVQYPDGQMLKFDGTNYTPAAGVFDKLTKTGGGFELLLQDRRKVIFNADGDITRLEDRNGNGINFSYGETLPFTMMSQITSIKADGGREITLTYNADGLVSTVTAPEGKVIKLEYTNDDLVKLTDGKGGVTAFAYTDHNLTNKTSPKGDNIVTNTYDGERRVTQQVAGEAFKVDFTYGGSETKSTDVNGKTTTYKFNGDRLLTHIVDANGKAIEYTYDSSLNVASYTDRDGNRYTYQYDSSGNQTVENDPLGNQTLREFDATHNQVLKEIFKQPDHITGFEYDSKGNRTKIINALGGVSTFTYNNYGQLIEAKDFNGNTTKYEYSAAGDLIKLTNAVGGTQQYGYDGLGRLVKSTNPKGFAYNYVYDANDNLTTTTGPLGYKLSYAYDANNNLVSHTDANGGTIKYAYNKSQKLVSSTNQLGFTTSYTYGAMHEQLATVDAEGRKREYSYDPTYNATLTKDAVGTANEIQTAVTFNGMRKQTSLTDAEGRVTKLQIDPLERITQITQNVNNNAADAKNNVKTNFEYSATGKLLKKVDGNGNATVFVYDALDRLIKQTDAENQSVTYEYDAQGNIVKMINARGFVSTYVYDALNRMVSATDAKGGVSKLGYDANSNLETSIDANGIVTRFTYNELDRVVTRTQNYVANQGSDVDTNVKTHYAYDLHGNLISTTNPRGFTTKFTYDAAHRNVQIIDAYNKVSQLAYDKVNNLLQLKDRNGNTHNYQYDALNRLIVAKNPENHSDKFSYDKVGNVIQAINKRGKVFKYQYDGLNRLEVQTDPYSKTKIKTYDAVGNMLSETDENGHADKFSYDKVYRLIKRTDAESIDTQFVYDQNGNQTKTIDGNGHPTTYTYDELDRLISKLNAENEEEKYTYDAVRSMLMRIEADGTQHKFSYDPLYRLTTVVDNYKANVAANSDTNVTTKYNYDANGNLIKQTDPLNNATAFEFDALDRLIKETNALNNNWQYAYDAEGNVIQRVDANAATTNYAYYPDYMLQQISYPGYNVSYQYSETNFPVKMQDNLGTTSWGYDDLDRLTAQTDPLNRSVAYKYDFVGNLTQLKYPDSRTINHTYLKNDWLRKSVSSDNDEIIYTRDNVGNEIKLDRTNSSYANITYDKVYRPLQVHDQQVGSGNHLISKFNYTYNDVGHITKEVAEYGWRQPSKVTTDFSYDGMHRLVKAQSSDDQISKYNYNAGGNRVQMDEYIPAKKDYEVRSYVYNAINQVISIDIKSPMPPNVVKHVYQYDKNGNRIDKLIQDGTGVDRGIKYTYDWENRLLVAQDYQGQVTGNGNKQDQEGNGNTNELAHTDMQYDGNGRRLIKTYYPGASQPGKRTEYTYDRLDPIVDYSMWNGQRNNLYRNANQDLMFYQEFKSEQAPNGTLYWYHRDGEGNIAGTTKHKAQSDHTYRYDEYGAALPENGNWTAPHNQYTLSQKEYDSNMGLHYFGARYYDPVTGSWINQDSYRGQITNPQSLHRYMYNYQSPVNYVDLYGHCDSSNASCLDSYPMPGPAPAPSTEATFQLPDLKLGTRLKSVAYTGLSAVKAGAALADTLKNATLSAAGYAYGMPQVGQYGAMAGASSLDDFFMATHETFANAASIVTATGPVEVRYGPGSIVAYQLGGQQMLDSYQDAKFALSTFSLYQGVSKLTQLPSKMDDFYRESQRIGSYVSTAWRNKRLPVWAGKFFDLYNEIDSVFGYPEKLQNYLDHYRDSRYSMGPMCK